MYKLRAIPRHYHNAVGKAFSVLLRQGCTPRSSGWEVGHRRMEQASVVAV